MSQFCSAGLSSRHSGNWLSFLNSLYSIIKRCSNFVNLWFRVLFWRNIPHVYFRVQVSILILRSTSKASRCDPRYSASFLGAILRPTFSFEHRRVYFWDLKFLFLILFEFFLVLPITWQPFPTRPSPCIYMERVVMPGSRIFTLLRLTSPRIS